MFFCRGFLLHVTVFRAAVSLSCNLINDYDLGRVTQVLPLCLDVTTCTHISKTASDRQSSWNDRRSLSAQHLQRLNDVALPFTTASCQNWTDPPSGWEVYIRCDSERLRMTALQTDYRRSARSRKPVLLYAGRPLTKSQYNECCE